jgi:hypothetical protein
MCVLGNICLDQQFIGQDSTQLFCRFPECRSRRVVDRNDCGSFAVGRAEEDVTVMTRMHAVEGFTPLQETSIKVHSLHDELVCCKEEKLQLPIPGGSEDDWGSDS